MTIVRVFLDRFFFLRSVTSDRRLVLLILIWMFFDYEQFIILLQWAVRAGICEENRLVIIDVCFPKIGIWRRVNRLGELLDSFVSGCSRTEIKWDRHTRENGAHCVMAQGNPRKVTSIVAPVALLVRLYEKN